MLITKQPTSNTTPDAGQGGSAVSSPTNTGHASTSAFASGVGAPVDTIKTCIWSGFQSVGAGLTLSNTLKITHSSSGALNGASASNIFAVQYSLNGGGNWNNAVSRSNFTALQTETFSVTLSVGQDLTQVQVRDFIKGAATDIGDSGEAVATISDIKLEVALSDSTFLD